MTEKKRAKKTTGTVDKEVLTRCLAAVESVLNNSAREMKPNKKAEVVAALYELCVREGCSAPPEDALRGPKNDQKK